MWSAIYLPSVMDRGDPSLPGSSDQTTHRRGRSYSQPVVAGPVAGPSHRPPEHLDFQQPQFARPDPSTSFPRLETDYDEDALFRSILAMTDDQHNAHPQLYPPAFPSAIPQFPSMPTSTPHPQQMQGQISNPLLSQAFVAWLQYMQLQMQLQQQQTSQQHSPVPPQQPSPRLPQQIHAPSQGNPFALSPVGTDAQVPFPAEAMPPYSPLTPDQPTGGGQRQLTNSPPPEEGAGEFAGMDPGAIAEEKRRRNTAASARFRIKKKQWTLNLERSITDLSGRVEELEREAAELRRENGWLKEIVMLKSKRFGGQVPQLDASASQSNSESQDQEGDETPDSTANDNPDGEETAQAGSGSSSKGKEVQRS